VSDWLTTPLFSGLRRYRKISPGDFVFFWTAYIVLPHLFEDLVLFSLIRQPFTVYLSLPTEEGSVAHEFSPPGRRSLPPNELPDIGPLIEQPSPSDPFFFLNFFLLFSPKENN